MAKDYKEIKQRLKSLRQKVSLLESDLDNTMYQNDTEYFDTGYPNRRVSAFPSSFFASDDDEKTVILNIINDRKKIRSEIEKVEDEIKHLKEKSSNNKIKSIINSLRNNIKI